MDYGTWYGTVHPSRLLAHIRGCARPHAISNTVTYTRVPTSPCSSGGVQIDLMDLEEALRIISNCTHGITKSVPKRGHAANELFVYTMRKI